MWRLWWLWRPLLRPRDLLLLPRWLRLWWLWLWLWEGLRLWEGLLSAEVLLPEEMLLLGGSPTSGQVLLGARLTPGLRCSDLLNFHLSGSPKCHTCDLIEGHLIRSQKSQIQVHALPEQSDHE